MLRVATAGGSKRPGRPMFDLGGKRNPGGPGQRWLDRGAPGGLCWRLSCVPGTSTVFVCLWLVLC